MGFKRTLLTLVSAITLVASVSSANVVATLTRAQEAVKTVNANSKAFAGLNAGVLEATIFKPIVATSLETISEQMDVVAKSNVDLVNNIPKKMRIQYLADMYALLAKTNDDNVSELILGKPLTAITAPDTQLPDDALDSSNVENFHRIIITALDASEVNAEALENAALSVTGHSFAKIVEACGSADAVSAR